VEIPETRYAITPDGVYLAYQVVGEGPVDLIWQSEYVEGNVDMAWEDSWVSAWLRSLAGFSRLILHDRRSIGLSSRNVPPPNLETRVADLQVILDEVGSKRPVLAGWYETGAPNVLFAASHPEHVHSIVWLEPTARCTWAPDYPWGNRPEEVEEGERVLELWGTAEYGRAFQAQQASRGNVFSDTEAMFLAKAARHACTPDVAKQLSDMWLETDVGGVLPAVQAPALLLVHNELDPGESEFVAARMPRAELRRMPGGAWEIDEVPMWTEEIRRFVGVQTPATNLDRVLATVLFTDIVGSTERAAKVGDAAWKELLERHHATVRHEIDRWHGAEVDTAGDGFFATFDGPARAVRCAQAVAETVRSLGLEIRAGVHTGEVESIDSKVGGIAVVIGARVAGKAAPSEVLVSQTVKDLVAGSGLTFEDAGEHELKGVPDRWHLYRVVS
jgi:class 3 adenylate cyclase